MGELFQSFFSERFELEKELKTNDRGCVLLVREREGNKRYIYREFPGSGDVYRRLPELDCPYLPKVQKVEEQDGRVAVLEEYIQGDTLAFILEGGPLPEAEAKKIAVQLCKALEGLHSVHAVHRDIKPENVILRGGDAVLIDFDASRIYKEKGTTDTRVMGTTGYAAPEQYGFTQTDARADIYSLGVLMNEMLTNRHPSTELAEGALRPVIERCIEVNVDKRFATAGQVRRALENGPGASGRGRRPLYIALGAAVAVVIAAALLVLLRGGGDDASWRLRRSALAGDAGAELEPWSRQTFTYDLDGDGEEETYLFGVGGDLPGRLPMGVDSRMLTGDVEEEGVMAAPCVWTLDGDGNYTVIYAFAGLLSQPATEVFRGEQWGPEEPEVWEVEPLDGYWDGAIEAVYTADTAGQWIYRATATLDGQALTATGSTVIERLPGLD